MVKEELEKRVEALQRDLEEVKVTLGKMFKEIKDKMVKLAEDIAKK